MLAGSDWTSAGMATRPWHAAPTRRRGSDGRRRRTDTWWAGALASRRSSVSAVGAPQRGDPGFADPRQVSTEDRRLGHRVASPQSVSTSSDPAPRTAPGCRSAAARRWRSGRAPGRVRSRSSCVRVAEQRERTVADEVDGGRVTGDEQQRHLVDSSSSSAASPARPRASAVDERGEQVVGGCARASTAIASVTCVVHAGRRRPSRARTSSARASERLEGRAWTRAAAQPAQLAARRRRAGRACREITGERQRERELGDDLGRPFAPRHDAVERHGRPARSTRPRQSLDHGSRRERPAGRARRMRV